MHSSNLTRVSVGATLIALAGCLLVHGDQPFLGDRIFNLNSNANELESEPGQLRSQASTVPEQPSNHSFSSVIHTVIENSGNSLAARNDIAAGSPATTVWRSLQTLAQGLPHVALARSIEVAHSENWVAPRGTTPEAETATDVIATNVAFRTDVQTNRHPTQSQPEDASDLESHFLRWATASAGVIPAQIQLSARDSAQALLGDKTRFLVPGFSAPTAAEQCQLLPNAEIEANQQAIIQVQIQIQGRKRILAEVLGEATAVTVGRQLEQLLATGILSHPQIYPTWSQGQPAVMVNGQVLFRVSPAVSQGWSCNGELLTIHWVNQLRLASGLAPLELSEAQTALHHLSPTPQTLAGEASWYGPYFHGRITATGEVFNQEDFTAAHKTLPFDTFLRVTNRTNGHSVVVRVNDRGPYVGDRIIDLSHQAAKSLGGEEQGILDVEVVILQQNGENADRLQTVAQLN